MTERTHIHNGGPRLIQFPTYHSLNVQERSGHPRLCGCSVQFHASLEESQNMDSALLMHGSEINLRNLCCVKVFI